MIVQVDALVDGAKGALAQSAKTKVWPQETSRSGKGTLRGDFLRRPGFVSGFEFGDGNFRTTGSGGCRGGERRWGVVAGNGGLGHDRRAVCVYVSVCL